MELIELLEQWHKGVRIMHQAHMHAAVNFERRARLFGIPVVIFSTAVGTSIFTGTGNSPTLRIVAGILSFVAAVLSSLQAALKYPELAAQHKAAAQKYGQLRRELEVYLAAKPEGTDLANSLDKFQQEWNALDDQCPTVPQKVYRQAVEAVASTKSLHTPSTGATATATTQR